MSGPARGTTSRVEPPPVREENDRRPQRKRRAG